ncbi:MAG: hypothetical protein VW397_08150 [Candidatus Margulisiibacteriota bacterium]
MSNQYVFLWWYLKKYHSKTFDIVSQRLPLKVRNYYNSKSVDLNMASTVECGPNLEFDFSIQILNEPAIVLAYYLFVFPPSFSNQLLEMIPAGLRGEILHELESFNPNMLSKELTVDLLSFLNSFYKISKTTISQLDKIRLVEKLVDDSEELSPVWESYCMNPKYDFFLFKKNDQRIILRHLIAKNILVPFLIHFDQDFQSNFLSTLSFRQKVFIKNKISLSDASNNDYITCRNNVIDEIRKLQIENCIDSAVRGRS